MSKKSFKILNKLTEKVVKINIEGTTSFFAYQPEVPEKVQQYLNKKKNDK